MSSVELGSVVLWLFARRLLPLIIRHGGGRGVSETAVFSCQLYRIASVWGVGCAKKVRGCSAGVCHFYFSQERYSLPCATRGQAAPATQPNKQSASIKVDTIRKVILIIRNNSKQQLPYVRSFVSLLDDQCLLSMLQQL